MQSELKSNIELVEINVNANGYRLYVDAIYRYNKKIFLKKGIHLNNNILDIISELKKEFSLSIDKNQIQELEISANELILLYPNDVNLKSKLKMELREFNLNLIMNNGI